MNKRDVIHLIIGRNEDIGPKTKTGCGELLENCGSGVTYEYRKAVNCHSCIEKVKSIARMRGDTEPFA